MQPKQPINLKKWVDENRHLLKPPVRNRVIWENTETIAMVVGGPNSRKDYHVNEGEELFYQIEGEITLKIIDEGKGYDIPIKEGEIFLLHSNIPHSPQRPANTIGLVIEHKRETEEKDKFQWYCENCNKLLHEETVDLTDIVTQLPKIFKSFYGDLNKRTCKQCGQVFEPPAPQPTEN